VSPRVAFATAPAERIGGADTDRPFHERACAEVGIVLEHRVWSDASVDWDAYDLIVVRSTWDYLDALDAFRTWLDRLGALGTLHNPTAVISWNLDKRYLLDLAAHGVPVIPTEVCATADQVVAGLARCPTQVVVKPVVSAGSRLTGRFEASDPSARALAGEILAEGAPVLIQPAVASVATEGEVSALVFGGVVSHSVRKGPILALGGGLIGGTYTERLAPEQLTSSRRTLVEAASTAISRLVAERFDVVDPLLYSRIDLVTLDDGSDVLLEAELAEPSFFLRTDPGAADRFARLLARRLEMPTA